MTKTSRMLLFMSLAVMSSRSLSSLMANPTQAANDSVHCVRSGYEFTVKVTGCEEHNVTINTCLGTCLSKSTPTGPNHEQVVSCTCCEPIKTENVDVELWCDDKNNPSKRIKYLHTIETATECACTSC